MLFSSPEFLFGFLPGFLILYFISPDLLKNVVLFFASLLFYFMTSGELTAILLFSVVLNWGLGILIARSGKALGTGYLIAGVIINLAPLFYYKYAVFFLTASHDLAESLGLNVIQPIINPILPIGISFFTFQAISYIADIYMARVKPARNILDFGMYHSCFPQLIAGPIVRYEEIESQVFLRRPSLDEITNGITQFCFGLGKKVILADNMGFIANRVFSIPGGQVDFQSAWMGIVAYTLQIYFDFSGYSDMAIGLGRILGFSYPQNFDQPYRSHSITEFWRRWHMTLSRWFRDYLYIPLGGNRRALPRVLFNLLIVFFLCGLWHGAAYTFVIWGLYHGGLLIIERLAKRWVTFPIPQFLSWPYAIVAVMIGWVFFRADSLAAALSYLAAMFSPALATVPGHQALSIMTSDKIVFLLLGIAIALLPRERFFAFARRRYEFAPAASFASLVVAFVAVTMMSVNGFSPFIYFRF
jgi:alginate O-acetyltransferase complex protein AlgI